MGSHASGKGPHTGEIQRELWRSESTADAPRVDTGLSMLWRARIMVAAAFLVSLPAIAVGLARTNETVDAASAFTAAQNVFDAASRVENDVATGGLALVRYETEPSADRGRGLLRRLDRISRSMIALQTATARALKFESLETAMRSWTYEQSKEKLLADGERPLLPLTAALGRARRAIDPQMHSSSGAPDSGAIEKAEVALLTADTFIRRFNAQAITVTRGHAEGARASLNRAGRDLLVTFVLLLFAFGGFVAFGPPYILVPVQRLRGLATRIEIGRIRDISAQGVDEVADVSRSLQIALRRLEDNDHRKTRKILEMRKLLREVLAHTADAILVLSYAGRVDYANPQATKLLNQEAHHIEQGPLSDVLFSPGLSDAVEQAKEGDVPDGPLAVTIEIADGRVERLDAELGVIRDSAGEIVRVIVVLRKHHTDEANT